MLMLTASMERRNDGRLGSIAAPRAGQHKAPEPGERGAQLGVGDFGEPDIEGFCLLGGQRRRGSRPGRGRKRQRSLDENQPGDRGMSEKQVDPLDYQWRAVLQVEGDARSDAKLQRAVAAERLGPGRGGELGPDHRGPFRLETAEDPATAAGDDRGGNPRRGGADGAQPGPALALARRAG